MEIDGAPTRNRTINKRLCSCTAECKLPADTSYPKQLCVLIVRPNWYLLHNTGLLTTNQGTPRWGKQDIDFSYDPNRFGLVKLSAVTTLSQRVTKNSVFLID